MAEFDKGMFKVLVLGIVLDTKTKKILIGKKENDPYIPNLSWCFPGGGPKHYEELEDAVKREVKEETGYNVESLGPIFARILPEDKNMVFIYYLCELVDGEEKPDEEFKELKWVSPNEVKEYFTTSIHPKLYEYLSNLEYGGENENKKAK